MGTTCNISACGRNFLTKEEKLELLKEYEENLAQELKGVKERMKELAKE